MARYETYHTTVAQAPMMRRWVLRAFLISLLLHGGLLVFFQMKKLRNFGPESTERLAPPRFVVEKVTIDPKTLQDPDEIRATLKDKPAPIAKIDVPAEKIEPAEISVKPQNPEIVSPILSDKPRTAAMNPELIAKIEASSAGNLDKELGSIANSLLKDSVRAPRQPVVFTLPTAAKDVAGGAGDHEGIPGVPSLDDALGASGPLRTGSRYGVRGGALFEYDKAELLQQAIDDLQKLGEIIKRNPNATFVIEGHTDSFGGAQYNRGLSQRRADAVKYWLVENMAIAPERVTAIGLGDTKLIVPGDRSIDEQAPNRRVEIVIKTNRKK